MPTNEKMAIDTSAVSILPNDRIFDQLGPNKRLSIAVTKNQSRLMLLTSTCCSQSASKR